jgi:glucose/arabinose dehydrogenase
LLTHDRKKLILVAILSILTCASLTYSAVLSNVYGQSTAALPKLRDSALKVEQVSSGLQSPTSMVFLDKNTLLVTEKNDGKVVIVDPTAETVRNRTAIDVRVNGDRERGLLGITAIHEENARQNGVTYVYLYFTESNGNETIRNRVYRYEWNAQNQTLVNPMLILDLPADPAGIHNGGKLEVDERRNYVYAVIGNQNEAGLLQNNSTGILFPDTSVIFRLNLNGSAPKTNPFYQMSSNEEMRKYYAYGIRNSFGLAVDPLTGILWDTENGQFNYDELNVVTPGFNSGWQEIMGPLSRNVTASDSNDTEEFMSSLVNLSGSRYSDPKFSWKESVAPTDITFLNSTRLGEKYANNIFVGDFKFGNLYLLHPNKNRIDLSLENTTEGLSDHVADNQAELSQVIFGTGFGSITDLETGPDGYLYILTLQGNIYRIVPAISGT